MVKIAITDKVQNDLVDLLYQQIRPALWAESLCAIAITVALWGGPTPHRWLIIWLISNLLLCGLARQVLVSYYHHYATPLMTRHLKETRYWLKLFGLGAFISGISWGITGSLFMLTEDMLRSTFVIFLLLGVTMAANSFYSANRSIYIIFLLPAFLPFAFHLLSLWNLLAILGGLSFIYIIVMFAISFYTHRLLYSSFYLREENIELVDNLSQAKTSLEKRTHELEKSFSLVKATLESTTDGILVIDSLHHTIYDFNKNFITIWQIENQALKNKDIHFFMDLIRKHIKNPNLILEKINKLVDHPAEKTFDELTFRNGKICECYSFPQYLGTKIVGRVFSFRDVTHRKSLEAKLFYQANFDALTNLPNRALLLDRLMQAIAYNKLAHTHLAVLFLDIDRFKLINDSAGHAVGDKLLIEVSKRLKNSVSKTDILSREGGDEFIIILTGLADEIAVVAIANQLLAQVSEPYVIEGQRFNITMSMGISFFPKDSDVADILIRDADIAMYHAKELGRANFQFYTEEMNKKVLNRIKIERQLRDALERNEFFLHYQPIVNLKTKQVTGFEALLRWRRAASNEALPADFIAVAEETGKIVKLGEFVLRQACRDAKNWQDNGFKNFHIAVNFSARQFKEKNFLEQVLHILNETNLAPRMLSIELTESIILEEVEKAINIFHELKKLGVEIIIDDFGTGYSSLNYLKRLPIDKLKIDKSFVEDLPHQADDAAITSAIIALASKLNLQVVAEGVENAKQLAFLIEHQCDEIQGFYFSKPLTAQECLDLLHKTETVLFF